jgi:hypothetical protein
MQGNWVVEIGGWMPRMAVAGDICFKRPWHTQGCTADDDDDDDDDDDLQPSTTELFNLLAPEFYI